MISAKQQAIGAHLTMAIETDGVLCLATAFGLIQGVLDKGMLEVQTEMLSKLGPEVNEELEELTLFNVIPLKDAKITKFGDPNVVANIGSITVFPDQVIAVCSAKDFL